MNNKPILNSLWRGRHRVDDPAIVEEMRKGRSA
jgi:hypothetical protein